MKSYVVIGIMEPDYGCEERMPGDEKKDRVTLKATDNEIRYVEVNDAELYEKQIDVGSMVTLKESDTRIEICKA